MPPFAGAFFLCFSLCVLCVSALNCPVVYSCLSRSSQGINMQNVVIVGTGLIGSSFGLALREAGFDGPITGVSSPGAIAGAIAAGAIDRGAPLAEAVAQADLVFLSQTIGRILDTIWHLDALVATAARGPEKGQ